MRIDTTMDDEQSNDVIAPPDGERVAMRALVLASCVCRASLEEAPEHSIARRTYEDLLEWVALTGLREEFEPMEWELVTSPLGGLGQRQRIDLGWRAEGLGVLAWALSRVELPPYDCQVDAPPIGDAIGFLTDDARQLLAAPMLRPTAELQRLADLMLTVHWRLRQHSSKREALDFVAFAADCTWADMRLEDTMLIRNDLALRGIPLAEVSESVFQECFSIARERQQAANWLIGTERLYSQVTCDT